MPPAQVRGRIAARLDDQDVHATPLHVLDGVLSEPGTDAAPLVVGVDADDLDHAHAFVERVQRDFDEPARLPVRELEVRGGSGVESFRCGCSCPCGVGALGQVCLEAPEIVEMLTRPEQHQRGIDRRFVSAARDVAHAGE